ncbi:MAG: flhB [Symbiobacteriaceae bacterium]|jgi:flagellar biosynthetic protein FlhB|nr:flhB [Symbiobacteriaceae bacterium]
MLLKMGGPNLYEQLARAMTETFGGLNAGELTPDRLGALLQDWGLLFAKTLLPIAGAIIGVGVAFGLLQGQLAFSTKPILPDFSRLNPGRGIGRIFSGQTVVETLKSLLKLALIGYVGYSDVAALIPQVPNLLGQNLALGVVGTVSRAVSALQRIGFGLIALGVLDYGYQYWEFRKSLRMTKQEVKQEHKQQEGNPELKQKQRQKARDLARRRKALKEVPKADVVITNPTHFAVAIRYKAGTDSAPTVVAKGADLLALRIKAMAKKHGVPTVENRPLARSLFATVEIGKSIPPELYQAVAEVLAFVYSLRRQKRRQSESNAG